HQARASPWQCWEAYDADALVHEADAGARGADCGHVGRAGRTIGWGTHMPDCPLNSETIKKAPETVRLPFLPPSRPPNRARAIAGSPRWSDVASGNRRFDAQCQRACAAPCAPWPTTMPGPIIACTRPVPRLRRPNSRRLERAFFRPL